MDFTIINVNRSSTNQELSVLLRCGLDTSVLGRLVFQYSENKWVMVAIDMVYDDLKDKVFCQNAEHFFRVEEGRSVLSHNQVRLYTLF